MIVLSKIKNIYTYIKSNFNIFFLGLLWTLFILFFTYTDLLVVGLSVNSSFIMEFSKAQCQYVSLFVNFGLVVMLVFDCCSTQKKFSAKSFILPFFAIALCLIILAHSNLYICHKHTLFVRPICSEYFSIFAYILFVITIYILKVITLLPAKTTIKKGVDK